MPDQIPPFVPLAVAAGGALAAYELLYKPWAQKRALQAITDAQIKANLAKGMGIEEAVQNAIAGACVAAAVAKLHIPADQAAPMCKGIGILAEKGIKYAAKGAVIAGKAIGKGVVVVGKDIGKGAAAVGKEAKAVAKGVVEIHKAVLDVPVSLVKGAGSAIAHPVSAAKKGVVNAVYRNPVAVARTAANVVKHPVDTVKSLGKALIHPVSTVKTAAKVAKKILCFGFCDLGDVDYLDALAGVGAGRARRVGRALAREADPNPFASHAANQDRAPARKRRSQGGLSGVAPARRPRAINSPARGAAFYTRHL